VYGRVITVTGWTYEYVRDEFDMTGLRRLFDYWGEHPPVHEMVASYLGVKSTKKKASAKPAAAAAGSNLRDLASEMGASGFGGITRKRAPSKTP
jgi:hypothetical protein